MDINLTDLARLLRRSESSRSRNNTIHSNLSPYKINIKTDQTKPKEIQKLRAAPHRIARSESMSLPRIRKKGKLPEANQWLEMHLTQTKCRQQQ
jgi:hypothetical protein